MHYRFCVTRQADVNQSTADQPRRLALTGPLLNLCPIVPLFS